MSHTLTLEISADWSRYHACHVREDKPPFPEGGVESHRVVIADRAVIGRRHSNGRAVKGVDVHLPGDPADVCVSHRHCVIEHGSLGWQVCDAGSTNGTWLNDATVGLARGHPQRLRVGDKIHVGLWTCLTVVGFDDPAAGR